MQHHYCEMLYATLHSKQMKNWFEKKKTAKIMAVQDILAHLYRPKMFLQYSILLVFSS